MRLKDGVLSDPMQVGVKVFLQTLFNGGWNGEIHAPSPSFQPGDEWNIKIADRTEADSPVLRWHIFGVVTRDGVPVAQISNFVDVDRAFYD